MNPYIIKSATGADGFFWAVIGEPLGFRVDRLHAEGRPSGFDCVTVTMPAALRVFCDRVTYDRLLPDWSSFRFPAGECFVVTRDSKTMAGAEALIFETQAAYDTYRRNLLLDAYEDDLEYEEGDITVGELLARDGPGDLDDAWRRATADEDGSREQWNTHFGKFHTDRRQVSIALTDLPSWIQEAAINSLTA